MSLSELLLQIPKTKVDVSQVVTYDPEKYIIDLIQERWENEHKRFALTGSISYNASEINQLEENAKLLALTYKEIIDSKKCDGVYTVINVISDLDPRTTHQNWLFFDVQKLVLERFEPSVDYQEFKINEFCEYIIETMDRYHVKITYNPNITDINKYEFHACKAVSSMLAVLHIKGIDVKDLKLTTKRTPPFMKILIDYLEGTVKHCKISPPRSSRSRQSANKLNYVLPS